MSALNTIKGAMFQFSIEHNEMPTQVCLTHEMVLHLQFEESDFFGTGTIRERIAIAGLETAVTENGGTILGMTVLSWNASKFKVTNQTLSGGSC